MLRTAHQEWRKWIAALCIALAALLYLEPAQTEAAHSRDHDVKITSLFGGDHYVHTHDDAGHADNDLVPDHDGSEPHAHYCGGAFAAYLASGSSAYEIEQAVLGVRFTREASANITRQSSSLDRPPRRFAII